MSQARSSKLWDITVPVLQVRDIQLTPVEIRLATKISKMIKKRVKGDRVNGRYVDDSDQISVEGVGCEIAAIKQFTIPPLRRTVIKLWTAEAEKGVPNCGVDLKGSWLGLPKPVEVKYSNYQLTDGTGILYMRTPTTEYGQDNTDEVPALSYWYEKLPDSYYVLFQHLGSFEYRFGCWGTRQTFFRAFGQNEQMNMKMGKGYPVIAVWWQRALKPKSFLDMIEP